LILRITVNLVVNMTDHERIAYLQEQVDYLAKEENKWRGLAFLFGLIAASLLVCLIAG